MAYLATFEPIRNAIYGFHLQNNSKMFSSLNIDFRPENRQFFSQDESNKFHSVFTSQDVTYFTKKANSNLCFNKWTSINVF